MSIVTKNVMGASFLDEIVSYEATSNPSPRLVLLFCASPLAAMDMSAVRDTMFSYFFGLVG